MYRSAVYPEAREQLAALPTVALRGYAEATAAFEAAPWDGPPHHQANPDGEVQRWHFGPAQPVTNACGWRRPSNSPHRVDAQVIRNLAITLAHCKRLEDALGPAAVLPTVVAQHGVVRNLLEEGCRRTDCPDPCRPWRATWHRQSVCLLNLGDHDGAAHYFRLARKAGHDARSPAYASYAAGNMSFVAYLSGRRIRRWTRPPPPAARRRGPTTRA